jgi:tRNA A22 N-methylase
MKKAGAARRTVLEQLLPNNLHPIVDVGADHGHVAFAVGAIATERMPGRIGRRDIPWVVCDGLTAFRRVGVAIIAGMGARTIAKILDASVKPQAVVLHAQDDPPLLRAHLAANGWQIIREALAPEAGRYAEVILAKPGVEKSTGLLTHYGPCLLTHGDPHILPHLQQLHEHATGIALATKANAREVYLRQQQRLDFLEAQLKTWSIRQGEYR